MLTTKEELLQKITKLLAEDSLALEEKQTMITLLSNVKAEQLQGVLNLFEQDPTFIKKISQNIQSKLNAMNSLSLSLWEDITKNEEAELKNM